MIAPLVTMYLRPARSSRFCRRSAFTLIELLTVISIIGILAAILIPVVGSAINTAKRQKTFALLNNIVSMVNLYKQEYKYFPTLTTSTTIPTNPTVLTLKSNAGFVPVMTGNLTNAASFARYNTRGVVFGSFSNDELNTTGTTILDPFGNDDIVVIMDTPGVGTIPAASIRGVTMTGGSAEAGYNANTVSVNQTVPVHAQVIVMSPGRGLTSNDAVTTWDPQ